MSVTGWATEQTDSTGVGVSDLIRLFFEDVASLPIVEGKRDYLPLTRRIRRGEVLSSLEGGSQEKSFNALVRTLSEELKRLEGQCRARGRAPFDVGAVGEAIEGFLDSPEVETPAALKACLGKPKRNRDEATEAFEALGWRCFYLLALLPPGQRGDLPPRFDQDEVAAHWDRVRAEAAASLTRLTEGTLRYVINNAVNYVGRGVPFLDLVQEGMLGLQIAAAKYDERKGHFQQYAAVWIRQRVDRHIADTQRLIRVPVHVQGVIAKLESKPERVDGDYGGEDTLFDEEDEGPEATHPDDDDQGGESTNTAGGPKHLRVAMARHYSLERTRLAARDETGEPLALEDVLVADDSVEMEIESRSSAARLHKVLAEWRGAISERNWQIMQLRLGFVDGEERTLAEAAKPFGLSRERVRQIEIAFLSSLRHPSVKRRFDGHTIRPRRMATFPAPITSTSCLDTLLVAPEAMDGPEDKVTIQRLIDRYVERGRPRVWDVRRLRGRKALLRDVLLELGEPAHYSVIHQKALERVPAGLHFNKDTTYTMLFYGDRVFRSFGNAIFGLVEWSTEATSVTGEVVFDHCPTPLLPPDAHPGAFFDSIEQARQLLSRRALTADAFWGEMARWVGGDVDDAAGQAAFDAWYAAGVIDRVRFASANGTRLVLTAPPEADLGQMRRYCLASLCRRVRKMPELLLALATLGRPTVADLQETLFGGEWAGYDVAIRLQLLLALGAARRTGNEWRLTDDGRAALAAFPDLELPNAGEENEDEDTEVEELLDLDLYEFDLEAIS